MNSRHASSLLVFLAALCASTAVAGDAYLVRFNGVKRIQPCTSVSFRETALLYNQGASPATVRVLGISNPPSATGVDTFTLPPGQVVDLDVALNGGWFPLPASSEYSLWTLHLDIPEGVRVESRDEVYGDDICLDRPQPTSLGRVSMPIFTSLTPANTPQVHLGTDLGSRATRTNVGVYNASSSPATAHVELRRACDDVVEDQRTFLVAPNTTVQVGALQGGINDICTVGSTASWIRYTVITVDQPSLTFVSNVTEETTHFDGVAPRIDLGVSHNTQF